LSVPDVPEIDIAALEELVAAGAFVLDVREDDEYTDGHVAGAIHVPLGTVPERFGELPTDVPIYVVCAKGARSGRAVQFLVRQGLDATNVAGGTLEWIESGRPVVTGSEPA
jgi:rhodanese-related sulfurtransferase